MKQESYGTVKFVNNSLNEPCWAVECRPQVAIRLKNVFQRAYKGRKGEIRMRVTDEVCRDLKWFLDRYPMDISSKDRKALDRGSRKHQDMVRTIEELIDPSYKPRDFKLQLPPRIYQRQGAEIFLKVRSLLCADDLGLGKTILAIAAMSDRRTLPAAVVTPANTMPEHWEEKLRLFLPSASTHIVKSRTPYELPKLVGRGPDVVILTYHKLSHWSTILSNYCRSVIFDEAQELRRRKSDKYAGAEELAGAVRYRLGLTGTPIYNMGFEIWNLFNVLHPGVLGTEEEFRREWCSSGDMLEDAKAMGTYLREQGLMIRRTRAEVGRELPPVTKIVQTVDADDAPLEEVAGAAEELAKIILSQVELNQGDQMRAAGELDWKLRQATGVAKAPHVASFVKMLVANGESVVIFGWHKSVYEILMRDLDELKPAKFTGDETQAQKIESRRRFIEKETPVLIMSLRAGIGLDGFQNVCRTVVFAELDWSHGVHSQCVGRVARDGQKDPTMVYFLVSDEGSDPVVSEKLGLKRSQIEGIQNPDGELLEEIQGDPGKVRSLAKYYLQKIGKWKDEYDLAGETSMASIEEDAS